MKIVIFEDDIDLAEAIARKLRKIWFGVKIYNNKESFILNNHEKNDLFIIDIILKNESWFDIIKYLREVKKYRTPIIITSGIHNNDKKIYWLNIWADDYLEKPFSPNELVARINALIRRSHNVTLNAIIKYKIFTYNTEKHIVCKNKKEIIFQPKEKEIIKFFMLNIWKTIRKQEFIESIWWEYEVDFIKDNTINVPLSSIRKKLWSTFDLKTIHWIWYILE